ncbi:HD domain-containing protein [Peptostreptococcus anaerobius]|uniref:HD domain-containing protein n=1 Tax=Peptostreptococcus anaerobius TaxID=1261 RepID=UPI001D0964B2|nr:HD domain-containing protein [Peptostreptococcus anaerobius]MCB6982195.1 HD domain-containing protein [Peptostreptococcus anaerobius]MCQ5150314.1 HD domain-containing protein [Peptostreptococcus anaerobius]MDU0963441.1 HD domain-containing protein [Peptostreptococcus anaerobius]MDU0997231.1 HD domain-containing protein [Peptostreptococcus anaerobius]
MSMEKGTYFSKEYCPTKAECFDILRVYGTPIHVQGHCNAVGEVGYAIARALNEKGLDINERLVASAGYLHDIARVHKIHEKVGANYLKSIGLEDVSRVISDHTKHKINQEILSLDEEDILCIADRLVIEASFVGPEKRMDYIKSKAIKKYGKESEPLLDKIKDDFIKFVAEIETFIGDEIINIIPDDIRLTS